MKTTTWAWIFGLGGAFTALAGYLASRAGAQTSPFSTFTTTMPTKIGGFNIRSGVTLSAAEQAVLAAIPTDPATPGFVHHDLQEVFDAYLANRQPDGSATINGTRYPNLQAVLATGGG